MIKSRSIAAVILAASLASFTPAAALADEPFSENDATAIASAADAARTSLGLLDANGTNAGAQLLAKGDAATLFLDTYADAWYSEEGWLDYVVDNSLIKGMTDGPLAGCFAPYDNITRGQVATVLWRMAGSPQPQSASGFSDVNADAFYYDAVLWAQGEKVVTGYSGTGTFRPDDPVTREQLATMMGRYAAYVGGENASETYASAAFNRAPGAGDVSAFAKGWMAWCYDNGLMTGNGQSGNLLPQDPAQRAAMAKMTTVLRRDVLGLPSSPTTQIEREEAMLDKLSSTIDSTLGSASQTVKAKVELVPASSGMQHAYWIYVDVDATAAEIGALINEGEGAIWDSVEASITSLSAAGWSISQTTDVDIPVVVRVYDSNNVTLFQARNGNVETDYFA